MIITKEAVGFLYQIFFSCYTQGEQKSEKNKVLIETSLAKKRNLDFDQFCDGLLGWDERKSAIRKVADDLKKRIIDKDVIACYFGGSSHSAINANDLKKENFPTDGKFYNYAIFNHALIPLKVKIMQNEPVLIGLYENGDISLEVLGILFDAKQKKKIKTGQTVLVHFPMVIEIDPSQVIVDKLLSLQRNDPDFMQAVKYFSGKNINHLDFQYFSIVRRRLWQ